MAHKRADLLARMRLLGAPRDDVHKRMVFMLVDLNRYADAVRMLEEDTFVPSEMDQSFRNAYVAAYLGIAQAHEQAGRLAEAIEVYKRALAYPSNVGSGRPLETSDAEVQFRLGCACERLGRIREAIAAWREAAGEHHGHGHPLFPYIQMSLDMLSRYGEVGLA